MVLSVLPSVLLGIVLLCHIESVANEEVDIHTLSEIQKYFHYSYESGVQYAVAINVQKEECQIRHDLSNGNYLTNDHFLIHDKTEVVKPYIQADSLNVYIGDELIAAGVHPGAHSEYLLMYPSNNSPLTHLLKRREGGCVVFYTLLSPCVDKCLNSDVILGGLDELQNYQGMKAFVYTHVYDQDQNKPNLRNELQKIAHRVPLYRCGINGCISCGNNVIDACLKD